MADFDGGPTGSHRPEARVGDADREVVVARIQRAMAEGYLAFSELDERFAATYRARTRAELDAVVGDLPIPAALAPAHHVVPLRTISIIGDVKRGGWISVSTAMNVVSVIGDTVIGLSSADIPAAGVVVTVYSLIGDITAIVPDGAKVQLELVSVIGDSHDAVVAPMTAGPGITLRLRSLIGDIEVYSLSQMPEGRLRRLWTDLRRKT